MEQKKVTIYFTMKTWERLLDFVRAKYGVKKALSITVEEAVKAYLATTGGRYNSIDRAI